MEYDKIEPIGPTRDDVRMALLGVRLAEAMGAKGAKLDHFLLEFDKEEIAGARDAEMEKQAEMLTRLFGGMDLRQR